MKNITACVLGANGFIGSHLVAELLKQKITVRACLRDPDNNSKISHLRKIAATQSADTRISYWHTELNDFNSLFTAITGCDWVFHLASPVVARSFFDDTVLGTRNVLMAINRATSVTGLAMTSSINAVLSKEPRKNYCFTESDWFDGANDRSYAASKTQAERLFWKYNDFEFKPRNLCMLVINPSLVIGPSLSTVHDYGGQKFLNDLLEGRFYGAPPTSTGVVHVQDVVSILVQGMKNQISGRYILNSETMWLEQVLKIMQLELPERRIVNLPPLANLRFLLASIRRHGVSGFRNQYRRWDCISSAKAESTFGIKWRTGAEAIRDFCKSR